MEVSKQRPPLPRLPNEYFPSLSPHPLNRSISREPPPLSLSSSFPIPDQEIGMSKCQIKIKFLSYPSLSHPIPILNPNLLTKSSNIKTDIKNVKDSHGSYRAIIVLLRKDRASLKIQSSIKRETEVSPTELHLSIYCIAKKERAPINMISPVIKKKKKRHWVELLQARMA